jgi:Predicted helicases
MKPVHAGLTGTDALYILDEVHLSQPFQQTLDRVSRMRELEQIELPFESVSMSATPVKSGWRNESTRKKDIEHQALGPRLKSEKRVQITETQSESFVETIVSHATKLVQTNQTPPRRLIGITVNTVRTARAVYNSLQETISDEYNEEATVSLIIGRAREWEKQQTVDEIEQIASKRQRSGSENKPPHFVVATQTIEVGADFDFDCLVTELAPIDSLRQRIGRLDRFGQLGTANVDIITEKEWITTGRQTNVKCLECGEMLSNLGSHLRAHDLTKDEYIEKYWQGAYEGSPDHPIYGRSIKHTWDWLSEQIDSISDNRIDLGATGVDIPESESVRRKAMCSPKKSAPTLLTPHVELFSQTSPVPSKHTDPDTSLFLHGPDTSPEDIQLIWRSDLQLPSDMRESGMSASDLHTEYENEYIETVAMRPPLPRESINLPLWAVDRWLSDNGAGTDPTNIPDVEGQSQRKQNESATSGQDQNVLIWRGREDAQLASPSDIAPGDTVIIPSAYGGHDKYAFNPSNKTTVQDISAIVSSDNQETTLSLPLTPPIIKQILMDGRTGDASEKTLASELTALVLDPRIPSQAHDIDTALRMLSDFLSQQSSEMTSQYEKIVETLIDNYSAVVHPLYSDNPEGTAYPILFDAADRRDVVTSNDTDEEILLETHLEATEKRIEEYVSSLPLSNQLEASTQLAGKYHDLGKIESRFQAWLHGGISRGNDQPLAKSTIPPGSSESRQARELAQYPLGRRHEAVSTNLLNQLPGSYENGSDDLIRYLIGTHHGHGRPLFPTPPGEQSPDTVRSSLFGADFDCRSTYESYKLGSGWSELFWRLTDEYGSWSLAYLESFIRIADQRVSEEQS